MYYGTTGKVSGTIVVRHNNSVTKTIQLLKTFL
jgi:hypothetical protein